jgi:hypothetical protein
MVGISLEHLAAVAGQPDADPFDLLCHLAFAAPVHTRRERVTRLRREQAAFFARYGPEARSILEAILDLEIGGLFGGLQALRGGGRVAGVVVCSLLSIALRSNDGGPGNALLQSYEYNKAPPAHRLA